MLELEKLMLARDLQRTVYASLLAALVAVSAYLPIPIGPVPIILQNIFILLAGLLLGSRWGLISMCIYLLVGAIGIPVFTGGKGGLAHFMGPTGGYLVGYACCAYVTGFIAERGRSSLGRDILAVAAGDLMLFVFGVPWLMVVTGMTLEKALLAGMLPFLPGDAVKAAAAVVLAKALRPVVNRQMETVAS